MKTKEIVTIRTLDDLRHAQSDGLERGDPILLSDGAPNSEPAVFLSEDEVFDNPAIVTVERSKVECIVRGLYVITSEGLFYQAHCKSEGDELKRDTEMYNRYFLF